MLQRFFVAVGVRFFVILKSGAAFPHPDLGIQREKRRRLEVFLR
jgi:hypothetical protein